jgi:segregation and condensation protein A
VLTVPLGALAGAFLEALESVEVGRIGSISGFVAVAGQLILIKSRALLPRPPAEAEPELEEVVDPEDELRTRLIEYQRFRTAAAGLAAIRATDQALFRREAPATILAVTPPTSTLERSEPGELVSALDRLALVVPQSNEEATLVSRAITLSERTDIIRAALDGVPLVVLQDLLAGVRDRVVVAVTFLAVLELVKRREVSIDQAEPWGPIIVRSLPPDGVRP